MTTDDKIEFQPRDEEFEEEEARESEEDLSISRESFEEILVAPSDWTVESLLGQIGKQIDLDPAFQRRSVWSNKAKSQFIESLFLNIPIPQILLAAKKEDKNSFIVLDGKQRLLTINQFVDGKYEDGKAFKLKDLRVFTDLEGKTWDEIQEEEKWGDLFRNQTLRTAVLRGWKNEDALYEIFYRLNSGSVRLSPMELRMALYPGDFLKFIIQWSEKPGTIHELLKLKRPDKRMADVELAVRYLAFQDDERIYRGNLKKFLDDACADYNGKFKEFLFIKETETRLDVFEEAIEAAIFVFGIKNVCRKWLGEDYESRFNRAVFDIQIGALSVPDMRDWALQNSEKFEMVFKKLSKEDNDFIRALETTTKSVRAVEKRFTSWYDSLTAASGIPLKVPAIDHAAPH